MRITAHLLDHDGLLATNYVTQALVAEKCGVSESTISKYEKIVADMLGIVVYRDACNVVTKVVIPKRLYREITCKGIKLSRYVTAGSR